MQSPSDELQAEGDCFALLAMTMTLLGGGAGLAVLVGVDFGALLQELL
jgi:hypothetical protein